MKPSGRDEFPISSRLRDNHRGDDVGDGNDDDNHSRHSLSNQLSTAWWS